MIRVVFLIICYILCLPVFGKPIPFIGYGYYENLHFGLSGIGSKKPYLSASLGINPFVIKNALLISSCLSAGKPLFYLSKKRDQKIDLQAKSVFWYYNNQHNRFLNLAIGPELSSQILIKSSHSFRLSAGVGYNFVLLYQRKGYQEVGWPREIQPTFSLTYYFKKQ